MTPLQIKMMLHYYTTPAPYAEDQPAHANSVVKDQREELVNLDLLVPYTCLGGWKVTDRGRAYIQHLTEVGAPVCQWVRP